MAMDLQSLILVVDDDPELRSLITEFLGGHGYRVRAAENALQMNLSSCWT
jgi:two-component system OmpR family response regulator